MNQRPQAHQCFRGWVGQSWTGRSPRLSHQPPQRIEDGLGTGQQEHQTDKRRAVQVPATQRGRTAAFAYGGSIGVGNSPVGKPHGQPDEDERERPSHGVEAEARCCRADDPGERARERVSDRTGHLERRPSQDRVQVQASQRAGSLLRIGAHRAANPQPVHKPHRQADERRGGGKRHRIAHRVVGRHDRGLQDKIDEQLDQAGSGHRDHGQASECQEVGVDAPNSGHAALLRAPGDQQVVV